MNMKEAKVIADIKSEITALQFLIKILFIRLADSEQKAVLVELSHKQAAMDDVSSELTFARDIPLDQATLLRAAQKTAFEELARLLKSR